MAPQVGLEPTTDRLTADSSTTELLRNNSIAAWQRPTLTGTKSQLPSALRSLTSVFGMGTGVTFSPLLPDYFSQRHSLLYCLFEIFQEVFEKNSFPQN
jgi:hypothetical protein